MECFEGDWPQFVDGMSLYPSIELNGVRSCFAVKVFFFLSLSFTMYDPITHVQHGIFCNEKIRIEKTINKLDVLQT